MKPGQRVLIVSARLYGTLKSRTEEGWLWVQVDSTVGSGVNHLYLAQSCELEEIGETK